MTRVTCILFLDALSAFSYPEPFLRAVNGARQGALAKSISNWHLIGYNEGYCSNNVYILLPCFYGIRFWIWPEPLVAPRVRRALGTRMHCRQSLLFLLMPGNKMKTVKDCRHVWQSICCLQVHQYLSLMCRHCNKLRISLFTSAKKFYNELLIYIISLVSSSYHQSLSENYRNYS